MSQMKADPGWGARLLDWTNAVFLLVMVLAILLQVVARYVFNHALPWPEELGRFLFAWIVFLGSASVIQADEMIKLDILERRLPPRGAAALRLLIAVIVFAFLLVMLKGGAALMLRQASQQSVGLEIPMGIVYFAIPVGSFLMAAITLRRIVEILRELGRPLPGPRRSPVR